MTTENKDERTLETDALACLGKILPKRIAKDAVHLAVFSAESDGEYVCGGAPVGLKNGKLSALFFPHVGIIDPFIQEPIHKGDIVQVLVYPRSIATVRHVWENTTIDSQLDTVEDRERTGQPHGVIPHNRNTSL